MKTLIYDVRAKKTPMEIESDISTYVVECVGWYKGHKHAGVDTNVYMMEYGVTNRWYVTHWLDSSDGGNVLVSEKEVSNGDIRLGPEPCGGWQETGQNAQHAHIGSAADMVNGYTPFQFRKAGGQNGGQKYLLCDPAEPLDFGISTNNTTPCFAWMMVMRHHALDEDNELPMPDGETMTIFGHIEESANVQNEMRAAVTRDGSDYNIKWDSSGYVGDCQAIHTDDINSGRTNTDNSGQYHVIGGAATAMTATPNGNGYYSVMSPLSGSMGTQSTNHQQYACGTAATSIDYFCIGKDTAMPGQSTTASEFDFEGRILEMAFWKSDRPIPQSELDAVRLYMSSKFAL